MHELSLTSDLLTMLEEQAETQEFTKVRAIWLEIGHLSCVAPEALRFCFDVAKRGTLAEGAALHIEQKAGHVCCRGCGQAFAITHYLQPCPGCGTIGHDLRDGRGLRVRELEVE